MIKSQLEKNELQKKWKSGSLQLADKVQYQALHNKLEILVGKLHNFLPAIQERHTKPYQRGELQNLADLNRASKSRI